MGNLYHSQVTKYQRVCHAKSKEINVNQFSSQFFGIKSAMKFPCPFSPWDGISLRGHPRLGHQRRLWASKLWEQGAPKKFQGGFRHDWWVGLGVSRNDRLPECKSNSWNNLTPIEWLQRNLRLPKLDYLTKFQDPTGSEGKTTSAVNRAELWHFDLLLPLD